MHDLPDASPDPPQDGAAAGVAEVGVITQSVITCPACGTAKTETMPTNACQYFYQCTGCGTLLRPKPGDCCVFCSYGSVPCPPVQTANGAELCCQSDEARATVEIRPGVRRPDWSVVSRPAAREALLARHGARSGRSEGSSLALPAAHDLTWRTMLDLFARLGRPPGMTELGDMLGVPVEQVRAHLEALGRCDRVGLDRAGGAIAYAYPFTAEPTEHRVTLHGHTLHALCAIDALGVGGMYGTDVVIASACRFCGTPIEIGTAQAGREVGHARPADAVVWFDPAYDRTAASSCCRVIAYLCSDDHLRQWLAASTPARVGHRLTLEEAMEVGRAIFEPVLAVAHQAPADVDRRGPGAEAGNR